MRQDSYEVLMGVDQCTIEDNDIIWTSDASGAGLSFNFCLMTSLYRGNGTEYENLVTRNNVLIEVSGSNIHGFKEGGMTMIAQEINSMDLTIK